MYELDLMDSSNNDYQLILELSKIVRNYKDKNKPVDRDFVNFVLDTCIRNDIFDVKDGIKFIEDRDAYGVFDLDTIYINFSAFLIYYNELKESDRFNNLGDHNMIYYHFMLSNVLHEYTHAKQYYLGCNEKSSKFAKIYDFCFDKSVNNPYFYSFYYDFFPIERYANVRSYYLSYLIMERVYGDKCPMLFRILFMNYLLKEYDVLYSPLEEFNRICSEYGYLDFNDIMPDYDILDSNLWDRIRAGVNVSYDEYNFLINLHKNMFDDTSSNWDMMKNGNIKKLILDYNKNRH